MDEGFESDEEYERRRYGRSSEYSKLNYFSNKNPLKDLIINDTNNSRTLIKTITLEETSENEFGDKYLADKMSSQQNSIPQFKQLEPLKMVKRDLSKEFVPSSSSTSSADTIVQMKSIETKRGS